MQAARLLDAMSRAFPEAMVEGHEFLVLVMPNHAKDRHVAAAAVHAGAQVIVTHNLRDFARLPDRIEAQSPDDFLVDLLDLAPDEVVALLRSQAAALGRPPVTFEQLLGGLEVSVPRFVMAVRARLAS